MKRVILTLALLCYAVGLSGQEFSVPKGYKFSKADDYAEHESNVVKCFDWLMSTPMNEQTSKRDKASAYLVQWLMGSPTVNVQVNKTIAPFMENADLLMIFMGGWAKYAIESKDKSKVEGNLHGLNAVIDYYQQNKAGIGQNKDIEKFIKMKGKGKLKSFIEKNA